jgi:hypothetical protein
MKLCTLRKVVRRTVKATFLTGLVMLGAWGHAASQKIEFGFHTAPSVPGRIDVVSYVDAPNMAQFLVMWRTEVQRRYPDAVMVVCHGTDYNGKWCAAPMIDGRFGLLIPMDVFVPRIQKKYPGRRIVMVTCNPGHYRLNIPGVVYALDSVWMQTDVDLRKDIAIGNIYEFTENQ